jgi:hypothetical protein
VPTENGAGSPVVDPTDGPVEPAEDANAPLDRQERWIRSVQQMFRDAIEAERRGAVHIVRRIDAALRGDSPDE